MTEEQWSSASGIGYTEQGAVFAIHVDTAWALLRFFRTGEQWTQETKRQWAEEEYAALLERDTAPKPWKPRLV